MIWNTAESVSNLAVVEVSSKCSIQKCTHTIEYKQRNWWPPSWHLFFLLNFPRFLPSRVQANFSREHSSFFAGWSQQLKGSVLPSTWLTESIRNKFSPTFLVHRPLFLGSAPKFFSERRTTDGFTRDRGELPYFCPGKSSGFCWYFYFWTVTSSFFFRGYPSFRLYLTSF